MVIRDALIEGSNILKANGVDALDARVLLKFLMISIPPKNLSIGLSPAYFV
jgi:hypothetical protein